MDRERVLGKLGKAMTATAYIEQVSEDEGYDITDDLKGIRQNISDSIALLTAEPEPCEDELEAAEASFNAYKDVHRDYSDICPKYGQGDTALRAASYIDGYVAATQVANKRVEDLRAMVETLREAAKNIIVANVRPEVLNTYEHPTSIYHPSFGGGDCEKHGRWYGMCHSCREEEKEAMEQAVYEANSKRGEALDDAFKELSIALAATEPRP